MAVCIFKRVLKKKKAKICPLHVIKLEIPFCRPLRSALFLEGVQATSRTNFRFLTRIIPMYSAKFMYSRSFSYFRLGTFQAP